MYNSSVKGLNWFVALYSPHITHKPHHYLPLCTFCVIIIIISIQPMG